MNAICMGIFHDFDNPENNASEDEEIFSEANSNGERDLIGKTFSGFTTCYFTITEISDYTDEEGKLWHNGQCRYQIRPVSERWSGQSHPYEQMNFVCYGIFTSDATLLKKYGCSSYQSRAYHRYLKNQNTY